MSINLTNVKSTIGEAVVVYAIGHFFGLKAKHILNSLRISALKGMIGIIQKISCIELNTGLVGIYLHNPSALRLVNCRARACHRIVPSSQVDAMVIALRNTQRLIRKVKIATDCFGHRKIKGSSLNVYHSARGDESLIRFKKAFGIHPQLMIKYLARVKARKIKIRMICKIYHRFFIGSRFIGYR